MPQGHVCPYAQLQAWHGSLGMVPIEHHHMLAGGTHPWATFTLLPASLRPAESGPGLKTSPRTRMGRQVVPVESLWSPGLLPQPQSHARDP